MPVLPKDPTRASAWSRIPSILVSILFRGHYAVRGSELKHTLNVPRATYAPWLSDKDFVKCHQEIKHYTGVDIYRLYERWSLVAETRHLPGALLEVGVWRGGTGALIAHRAHMLGIEDPVYLCDTFRGLVKVGPEDPLLNEGEFAGTSPEMVERLLESLGVGAVTILNGIFPDETGHVVSQSQFRFCHIDVDSYGSARDVTEWVWERLVTGGIVVYDDYGCHACEGITRYVNTLRALPDRLFIHNLNGHAILVKR